MIPKLLHRKDGWNQKTCLTIERMAQSTSVLRVLGKMAGKRLSNDRVMLAGIEAARTTAKAAARASHILFLEIAGVLFIGFGLAGIGAAIREYRIYAAGRIGPGKVVLAVCFSTVFFYFAVTSFWKARKQ